MECVVCQDAFNADTKVPRVLSCGHTFCGDCVKLMLDHSEEWVLNCIVCKLPHYALVTSPIQVPYNFALLDIMFVFNLGGRGGNVGMRGRGGFRRAAVRGRGGFRGAPMRGRGVHGAAVGMPGAAVGMPGAAVGMPGYGAAGTLEGFGYIVPDGPIEPGMEQGLLQMVPQGGPPPPIVTPYGHGSGSQMPISPQGQAEGVPEVSGVPAPVSRIGHAVGGSHGNIAGSLREALGAALEHALGGVSRSQDDASSSTSSDEECPNNRQLNAPNPIGEKFRVTLQQSPGMVWFGGRLQDGNTEQFAFVQNAPKKKYGHNRRRNCNRGRGRRAAVGHGASPEDPEQDAIHDYVPILGPK